MTQEIQEIHDKLIGHDRAIATMQRRIADLESEVFTLKAQLARPTVAGPSPLPAVVGH